MTTRVLRPFLIAVSSASNLSIAEFLQVMAPPQPKSGLFVGLNEGHIVTRKELAPRPSARKGKTSKRVHFVKNLIREVVGFVPYEKMITELLKVGKDKRALKLAKRKLGTHKRAKKKREEMYNVLRKMREYTASHPSTPREDFRSCHVLKFKLLVGFITSFFVNISVCFLSAIR